MNSDKPLPIAKNRRKTVAVIGLGNIGSCLIGLVARMPAVGRIVLIDDDFYEPANVAQQDIAISDVGMTKVEAQRVASGPSARRLTWKPSACAWRTCPWGVFGPT